MSDTTRHLYIGAVALICRMHAAMGPQERKWFDEDGDPMSRLCENFNQQAEEQGYSLRMEPNGHTWTLSPKASIEYRKRKAAQKGA